MPLDQSRPLMVPPSIIYWSAKHKLPVYVHPRFDPDSTRVYARPYAKSTDGFSDYSAAEQRQELGLPPLEDPTLVRPRDIMYSLDCLWCPDEAVLAERVAALLPTLRPDDEELPPPEPQSPQSEESSPEPDGSHELRVTPARVIDAVQPQELAVVTDLRSDKRKRGDRDDREDAAMASRSSTSRRSSPIENNNSSAKRRKLDSSLSPHRHKITPIDTPSDDAHARRSSAPVSLVDDASGAPRAES